MKSPRKAATIRVGNVGALPDVYQRLGLDFASALRRAGLQPGAFDDAENVIPFLAVDALYAIAAEEADCEHFGLLVGVGPLNLGLPGFLATHAPTMRIGLQRLVAFHNRVDSGGVAEVTEQGDIAIASYTLVVPHLRSQDQMYDTAMAITAMLFRRMLGDGFAPHEVRLPFKAPKDISHHRSFYRRWSLKFGCDQAAIVFPASCLDRPIKGADPVLFSYLLRQIETNPFDEAPTMAEQIRRILPGLIRQGEVKGHGIAKMFGLHPRTMSRRLAAENLSVHELVEDARFDVARRLLNNRKLSLTQIAAELYYADASAFTRAFRRRYGVPPGAWRRAQGPARTDNQPSAAADPLGQLDSVPT